MSRLNGGEKSRSGPQNPDKQIPGSERKDDQDGRYKNNPLGPGYKNEKTAKKGGGNGNGN